SLARPGGNITGVTNLAQVLNAKRLEILKETLTRVSRVAVLWNPAIHGREHEFSELEDPARTLGIQLQSLEVQAPDEYPPAFQAATDQGAEALLTLENFLTYTYQAQILDFAARTRLPSMYGDRGYADAGGLMAYGPSIVGNYHRAAYYVDRILQGAK